MMMAGVARAGDHQLWNLIVAKYVDDDGRVAYRQLQADDRPVLSKYLASLGEARIDGFPAILTDFETIGTLTRSVEDASLLDAAMAGPDARDRRSLCADTRPLPQSRTDKFEQPQSCAFAMLRFLNLVRRHDRQSKSTLNPLRTSCTWRPSWQLGKFAE